MATSPVVSPLLRLSLACLLVALALPFIQSARISRAQAASIQGPSVAKRANSPTDVCFRWAQQSAVVNGTLYLYGGQATTQAGQTDNTWNNDFLSLDLTKTWNIASPALTGLPPPSGPPDVALGYLWNSHSSLWLYGGEFSWKPVTSPVPFATWQYDIGAQSWQEHSSPKVSSGVNAPDDGVAVQRAAEGAGVSVPSLGRGFYFGGHLDGYTTDGWSQSIPRVYLQSLLEYTFPDHANDQVTSLKDGNKLAGADGVYRNITESTLQQQAGFTKRADGLLIYVPGFSPQGILLALAGGTNETFTQMNNIDVYDIATSTWYKQSTSGPTPGIRVNPCAVAVSAPDGSSTNIYMFGGQSLLPYGNQTQYNDMWILTLPSFTWIQVNMDGQSVPYGRSGHTCNVWDSQMVVVGGYVGNQLTCESPGIYVFNLSSTQWTQQFTAMASPNADPFNQQLAHESNADSSGQGLEGSYGYTVPEAVVSVVGGDANGGATVTTPQVTATGGPLATGTPSTWKSGNGGGSNGGSGGQSGGDSSSGGSSGPNIAAIVVGVVCGLLFILACYLAFCAYIYRKQLHLYKQHSAMAAQQAHGGKTAAGAGFLAATGRPIEKTRSNERRGDSNDQQPWSWWTSEGNDSSTNHTETNRPTPNEIENTENSGFLRRSGSKRSRRSSVDDDRLIYHEPTFVGVMLNPRRSLRVVNRD